MTSRILRIAIYIADLDVRGGTHKQVLKLAQYLNSNGHTVAIFTPCYTPDKTYPEFSGLNIVSLRSKSNDHLLVAKLFGRLFDQYRLFMKSRKYDIVNPHDNRTKTFILLHAIYGKAKQVWQINDIDSAFGLTKTYKRSFVYSALLAPLNRFCAKLAASVVNKITVNVTKNADRVYKHFNQNASVIYCGVDFLPRRSVLPILTSEINVVSTGVVFRYRNYEALIDAAAITYKVSGKIVRITIVGDTRYDKEYVSELKIKAGNLHVPVFFTGSVSQNELNQYYENAHLFSFINVDQSWGLAVFEAASMGLPVVLSKSVGAIELLDRKPGIFVVEPESPAEISNAILKITNDEETYGAYCSQVSGSVQDMSWDKMYSKNIELIFLNILQRT